MHLSNRKQRYTAEIFLRPAVRGQRFGGSFGAGYGASMSQAAAGLQGFGADVAGAAAGAMGQAAANAGAAPDDSGAMAPGIASLGLTPTEQARAQQRQDQEFDHQLLESSGAGPMATPAATAGDTTDANLDFAQSVMEAGPDAETARRQRAASHGSLREARHAGQDGE